jgi:AcrR family transcriptional regulator
MVQKLQQLGRGPQAGPSAATDRGEQTRQEILAVAARAIADKGYAGASLNDIIREAGVTKGGFYFHFPSKEAMAIAVLRHKQEQWAARVLSATMRHTSAIDQMNAMVDALIDLHEQDPAAQAIGRICQELSQDPAMRPQLAPQFEVWTEMTASLFAKGQEEGVVRHDLDSHAMGEAAVATFIGLEIMSQVEGTPFRPRVRRYVDLFTAAFSEPTPD